MKFTRYYKWILAIIIAGIVLITVNYGIISYGAGGMIFKEIKDIPQSDICVILGAPKYLPDGNVNDYYTNRIKSAADLYENHKVTKILISADTINKYFYNEVELIRDDLLQNGIHDTVLLSDKYGNDTRNSILGLKNFKAYRIIIVSQKFHLERALYLAHRNKLNALGYISAGKPSFKLIIREAFSRIKMQIDLLLH